MGDNFWDLSNIKMNIDFLRVFSSDEDSETRNEDSDGVIGAV